MSEPRWVLDDVVLAVHSILLAEHGGTPGLRDENLLASALSRPKNKFNYDASVSIHQLAAAYSFGIAKNHPFVDGNKRAAFMAGSLLLELIGFQLTAAEPDAVVTFERLAAGDIGELELASWFETNSTPAQKA